MDQTPLEKMFGIFADLSRRFKRDRVTNHPGSKKGKEDRKKKKAKRKAASRMRAIQRRRDKQSSKRTRS
jgi:hypothetical protein